MTDTSTAKSVESPLDLSQQGRLKFEQIGLLYEAMPTSIFAILVSAVVLVAVEWDVTDHSLSLVWLSSILLVTFARFGVSRFYQRAEPDRKQAESWRVYFNIGAISSGIVWGSASFLLFPEGSVVHQVFLAFIVGGMCAGAMTSLSPLLLPIYGFLLLALLPLIVRFFIIDSEISHMMAGMLCLFLIILFPSAFRIHRNIKQNILLRMRSQASEAAVLESERHFRELFQKNGSVELIVDPDHDRIIEANHAAEKFYGYDREDLLALKTSDLNALSVEQMQEEAELTRLEKRDYCISRHRLASGEVRDVEVYSGLVSWNRQDLQYLIVHDISRRKRAEFIIKKNSEILAMVASEEAAGNVYDAICHMYESIHPRMRTSILRLRGNQLFHCSAPSLPEEYSRAIDGVEIGPNVGSCGTAAFLAQEVIVSDIATDLRWHDYKAIALPHQLYACWSEPIIASDGSVLGTFAMYFSKPASPSDEELQEIRDASGLVAIVMERERRKVSLNKFSQAISQAGESIMITDKDAVIEYINPAFTHITGYAFEEVVGKNPRILKSGKQSLEFYEKLWNTITSGNPWHGSVVNCRKDGSQYPSMMSIAPILEDGKITHYIATHQDMSSYELLEDKFRQAQKMQALGILVGGIAHDFNNMLAGMVGNLYLAKKKLVNAPEVMEKLERVEKLSLSAADMVKQLLVYARKDAVKMKTFGLTSFMREISKLCESIIPENIRFKQQLCHEELVVKGDRTQLQQVLMNLLNNARDAVAGKVDAEILLELSEFEANDNFTHRHPKLDSCLFAHFVVQDNGMGIGDEEQELIFDPFFTTKEVGLGTGLGLSMVYGAIQGHGGVIELESSLGQGTAFHIYLPLIDERKIPAHSEEVCEPALGGGELILLVDDNAELRSTVKEVLQNLSYRVLEASDGLKAVEVFEANQNDIALVIMDVVMPNLGGIQAAERIRDIFSEAKIIFATGYDRSGALKSEMPSAETSILSKPYDINMLSKVIRRKLDA